MASTDKVFVACIIAIVIVGIAALAMDSINPGSAYRTGTAPIDVAHNYLTALQRGDYQLAYEQLSPNLQSYPQDRQMFVKQINNNHVAFPLDNEEIAVSVLSERVVEDWATVEIDVSHFYNDGPFSSSQSSRSYELELERVDGVWKIADGEIFFIYCWVLRACTY